MTKEEYETLLKSDYWKGYSYSLIKERNFTCEDCGKQFYNERNKLQVHHLVYRDVAPWSYRPDELVVLCEECHKKRHGISTQQSNNTNSEHSSITSNYTASSTSNYNNWSQNTISRSHYSSRRKRRLKFRHIIYLLITLLVLSAIWDNYRKQNTLGNTHKNTLVEKKAKENQKKIKKGTSKRQKTKTQEKIIDNVNEANALEYNIQTNEETYSQEDVDGSDLSTLELLERRNHADVVEQARRVGVSTEGSTLEILERINHAEVVKQAQSAGISSEGSTLEILERINHAEVVKQAQRAGVSTEGNTLDILERINHAEVVKQAQRAGVSTEGSTLEILERINRKSLEKYN